MRVLVAGGTGVLGSAVVSELRSRGHEALVLSRSAGPDRVQVNLLTGGGLARAAKDAEAVVHCATAKQGDARVTEVIGTRSLARLGLPLLYISIVGVDKHPLKYYRIKLEGELALQDSGCPWTILRATQFHVFVDDLLKLSRATVSRVPGIGKGPNARVLVPKGWLTQPVDHHEVAARMTDLVLAGPIGRIEEFGGPQQLDIVDMAREWARVRGGRIVPIPAFGRVSAGYRKGLALAGPNVPLGTLTWSDYLRGSGHERSGSGQPAAETGSGGETGSGAETGSDRETGD